MIPRLVEFEPVARAYTEFLEAIVSAGFTGDVEPDFATRLVTATDNSVYQLLPQAVLYPKTRDDVVRCLRVASEERFRPITFAPRGGGTGTNGQSLTDGIVLDVSRHLNAILDLDLDGMRVTVQPGVVLDQLNAFLEPHGVFFAPNLSPSSRATIGGMIGTDACGKGSRIYGRTSQHVLELETILADGQALRTRALTAAEVQTARSLPGAAGRAISVVDDEVTTHADLIAETFPKLLRFMTGYNLARVRRGDVFDLNALLAGSEGTLGVTTEAVLKLTPIPTHRQLVVLKYASFEAALASAEELVASDPGAIETIDETVLTLARKDVIWHAVGPILGNDPATKCVNLVEYEGSDAEQVMAKAEALRAHDTAIGVVFAADDAETAALWSLRKKGVGLLGNKEGRRQPIAFVEDTVVPPENLRAYVREFRAILDEYGLYYGMFGHIDVGCLHVRPALDMTDPEDAKLLRVISDRVVDVVQKYGGVIWGEHGKGLRSEYNPRFFGETLYGSLCRIKAAFDPHNQLNPGKLAVPPGADRALMTIESPTRGERDREIREDAREPFDRAVACNGNGQCFHWDADHVMCPSYKVTRSRVHSPKGRAGIIREWLRQLSVAGADPASELDRRRSVLDAPARWWHRLRGGYDYSHEVFEAMDGCFTCKACATQCPIRVDVPELRSRFLTLYHRRYPRPLRDWLVAGLEGLLPVMARTARLANVVNDSRLGRWLLRKIVGLVDTPRLSVPTAAEGLQARGISFGLDPTAIDEQTVLLLPDAFTTFYEADVLLAAIDVLRGLGYRVQLLDYVPSGKALHVKGFRRRFLASAARSAERLKALSAHGAPILGLDPAVTLYWREEVVDAIGERGYRVHLLQEWLAEQAHEVRLRDESPYTLYGHCAERTSVPGSDRLWAKVFEGLGLQLRPERVGCCGMCGVFGHEARHHEESRRAFELSWAARLPTTEDGRRRALATGHSCRSQTKRFAGFRPRHPLEALAELMRTDPDEQR